MTTMNPSFLPYRKSAAYLKSKLAEANVPLPTVGIICGSGLSGLSATLSDPFTIEYKNIPGFPNDTIVGQKGEIVFGMLADGQVPTICFRGRFHSYEGHDMDTVALPTRVMRCLGVKLLLVTNAAGGLNPKYDVGDVVSIMDYFALPMLGGKNPLVGENDDELGPRFPPTSNLFDDSLQDIVVNVGKKLKFSKWIHENGVYCFVSGPQYESRAECRFLRSIGGDSVGMSTVPEMVVAHHSGMKVLALSLITNKAVIEGSEGPAASHEEVLDAVNARSQDLQSLIQEVMKELDTSGMLKNMPNLPEVDLSVFSASGCPVARARKVLGKVPWNTVWIALAAVTFGAKICQQKK